MRLKRHNGSQNESLVELQVCFNKRCWSCERHVWGWKLSDLIMSRLWKHLSICFWHRIVKDKFSGCMKASRRLGWWRLKFCEVGNAEITKDAVHNSAPRYHTWPRYRTDSGIISKIWVLFWAETGAPGVSAVVTGPRSICFLVLIHALCCASCFVMIALAFGINSAKRVLEEDYSQMTGTVPNGKRVPSTQKFNKRPGCQIQLSLLGICRGMVCCLNQFGTTRKNMFTSSPGKNTHWVTRSCMWFSKFPDQVTVGVLNRVKAVLSGDRNIMWSTPLSNSLILILTTNSASGHCQIRNIDFVWSVTTVVSLGDNWACVLAISTAWVCVQAFDCSHLKVTTSRP